MPEGQMSPRSFVLQFVLPVNFFFFKNDRTDVDIFILNSESLYLVIKILFTLLFPMSS